MTNITKQLEKIKKYNKELNILISEPENDTLNPINGDLSGVTISLKDNIDFVGTATTAGLSKWSKNFPDTNAVVTQRLIDAGATIFGKSNMTELAWGVTTYSSAGGQCKNPWNIKHLAGGSSGGSGASVAAGFCNVAIGTDTGGSIRLPAAFNGVVGLRPTLGVVPTMGSVSASVSHDTIGPLARNVSDIVKVFNVIAGYHENDPFSIKHKYEKFLNYDGDLSGVTIGIPDNYYFDNCDEEVISSVIKATKLLEGLGAKLKNVHVPLVEQAHAMANVIMCSEVAAQHLELIKNDPDAVSKSIKDRIIQGSNFSGIEFADALYFKKLWQNELKKLYQDVDLIIIPTTTQTAPLIENDKPLAEITKHLAQNTYPSSLAGIPSMSVPCGFSSEGMPIGMLLESFCFNEAKLFRVAAAYQSKTDFISSANFFN